MGGEPPGEIVERLVVPADQAGRRGAKPRLDLGDTGATAIEIRGQHLGP